MAYEIASVVSLLRNDIMTQSLGPASSPILDFRWSLPSKVLVWGGNDGFEIDYCRSNSMRLEIEVKEAIHGDLNKIARISSVKQREMENA